jgi:hypothetical protein
LLAGCSASGEESPADMSRYLGQYMPYGAFEELPSTTLPVRGGTIRVAFAPGKLFLSNTRVLDWVTSSASALATYYGRFPVEQLRLLVVPVNGRGVRSGTAFSHRGAAIKLMLGKDSELPHLTRDWVLVHEMVHMAFPSVNDRHHWIEEGLATYVEGIARAQVGHLSAEQVWGSLVDGLPQGLPGWGDRGLDHTPTWGRTYWGGALFCFLADVQIRQRTENRKGLQHALRGIVAAGGTMEVTWPITKAFRAGDDATGVPVLMELYEQMRDRPVEVDLPAWWKKLGIEGRGNAVSFQNDAPLASIRRAITAAPDYSAS